MIHQYCAQLVLVAGLLFQQASFEVISIKISDGTVKTPMTMTANPSGIMFVNVTALDVIANAYSVKDYQVAGPNSLKADRYEIVARTPSPSGDAQIKAMLQTLLAERFKLVVHHETKDLSAYTITQGKNGTKLRASQGGRENSLSFQGNKLAFRSYSIAALAKFLSSLPSIDHPVVDATGLEGNFDFEISIDAEGNGPDAMKRAMLEWASLFTDLDQQLGLKVEARKGPIDTIVVDRIEKPTPN
jgi:uncharacterized protein (TIGR03435 family)